MRPLSRRIALGLVLFNALLVGGYFATRIYFFVRIFMPHSGVALTQDEVALAHNATTPDPRPAVVPKIIHQIFHNWTDPANETLPSDWEAVRQTCIAHNPDWEYRLWTPALSETFLSEHYAWFLPTYASFRYPVQKIDTLRYFLMLHYGGIYLDLDNGCLASLEPLRYYPAWVTDGGHGTLSNNILGATPDHPFWRLLTGSITTYAWDYPLPYLAVSYATGQWFETDIWEQYHRNLGPGAEPLTRVMMDMRPGAARWVFFTQERGGTWNQWDNELFSYIGNHLVWLILKGAAVVAGTLAVGFVVLRVVRRVLSRRKGYRRVGARSKPDGLDEEMELS